MCGIIGAVAQNNIVPILVQGLQCLEYRGYDSAGIAVVQINQSIARVRVEGKVLTLSKKLQGSNIEGIIGIAHTRWATHGVPSEQNAHPHIVEGRVALVHNGIIENYLELKLHYSKMGYVFSSETDSEVAAVCVYDHLMKTTTLLQAVQQASQILQGSFALCVLDKNSPDSLIAIRRGSPLVIGIGEKGHYIASDTLALQTVANSFIYLEEGDSVQLSAAEFTIYNDSSEPMVRLKHERNSTMDIVDKGEYPHFMLKEIFEQPNALHQTLIHSMNQGRVLEEQFGDNAAHVFQEVQAVHIVACGTSFYAGSIARFWFEEIAGIACQVEIASEFRYRTKVISANTLLVCISQSGETADTLAALRSTLKDERYCGRLAICNVLESTLKREADLFFLTRAGREIGVCSTKAFTAQLMGLFLLVTVLGRAHGLKNEKEVEYMKLLEALPAITESFLSFSGQIRDLAQKFVSKQQALFLGRGIFFPVALEGALKLKELSYIYAEAYPGGELKHGPLALVDKDMLVIVVAPTTPLLEKLKSNIQEVRARGGEVIVLTDHLSYFVPSSDLHVLEFPSVHEHLAPIAYTIPLQLLAYYVALLKGTDIDQPRNLAKSVTVE